MIHKLSPGQLVWIDLRATRNVRHLMRRNPHVTFMQGVGYVVNPRYATGRVHVIVSFVGELSVPVECISVVRPPPMANITITPRFPSAHIAHGTT